uniref:Uncharacterized protein n=1 Tax=Megaselia scalaris TaxID=36166 RepID=T1GT51_MEGSC
MQQQSGDQKLLKKQENSGNPSELRQKSRLEIAEEIRMKRRTLSGTCGVGVFAIAFIAIALAFATPSWLVSDNRITGAKLDKLGLWVHCFRSLPDVNDNSQRRFFVGCRWVYDPFTTGYDEIRGFLLPPFMIATHLGSGICGSLAVIIFASLGNRRGWMLETANNWFGWSFGIGCVGSVLLLVVATLFLTEAHVQVKKRRQFKESQTRFELNA